MPKRTSLIWTIPHAELVELLRRSYSIKAALMHFGLKCHGTTFKRFKARLVEEHIDLKEILATALPPRTHRRQRLSAGQVLTPNSNYSGSMARRIVVRDKLLPYVCALCDSPPLWRGKTLVLRLDHIDGNNRDHTLKNLRWVCPNCDSQLPTFTGRNQRHPVRIELRYCACGQRKHKDSVRGVSCGRKRRMTINWPSLDEVKRLVDEKGYSSAGRMLGVSDNAVRKHLRNETIFNDLLPRSSVGRAGDC